MRKGFFLGGGGRASEILLDGGIADLVDYLFN